MLTISLVIIEVLMVVIATYLIAGNSLVDYSFAGNTFARNSFVGNIAAGKPAKKNNLKYSYNHSSYKVPNFIGKIFSFNILYFARTLPAKLLTFNKFKTAISSFYKIYQKRFNRKNKVPRVFIFTEKYSLSFQNVAAR